MIQYLTGSGYDVCKEWGIALEMNLSSVVVARSRACFGRVSVSGTSHKRPKCEAPLTKRGI